MEYEKSDIILNPASPIPKETKTVGSDILAIGCTIFCNDSGKGT